MYKVNSTFVPAPLIFAFSFLVCHIKGFFIAEFIKRSDLARSCAMRRVILLEGLLVFM